MPHLRVHTRVRRVRSIATAHCARGEPAGRGSRTPLRGPLGVDRAATLRSSARAGELLRHASHPRSGSGAVARKLGIRRAARSAMIALALLASYLAGSIPFGLLVARAASGKDVRVVGSGNIGATNVARAAGRTAAAVTLLFDALKGFLPAIIAAKALPEPWGAAACGIAAVLGHCFPVWLRFRGRAAFRPLRRRGVGRLLQALAHLQRRIACGRRRRTPRRGSDGATLEHRRSRGHRRHRARPASHEFATAAPSRGAMKRGSLQR